MDASPPITLRCFVSFERARAAETRGKATSGCFHIVRSASKLSVRWKQRAHWTRHTSSCRHVITLRSLSTSKKRVQVRKRSQVIGLRSVEAPSHRGLVARATKCYPKRKARTEGDSSMEHLTCHRLEYSFGQMISVTPSRSSGSALFVV